MVAMLSRDWLARISFLEATTMTPSTVEPMMIIVMVPRGTTVLRAMEETTPSLEVTGRTSFVGTPVRTRSSAATAMTCCVAA